MIAKVTGDAENSVWKAITLGRQPWRRIHVLATQTLEITRAQANC